MSTNYLRNECPRDSFCSYVLCCKSLHEIRETVDKNDHKSIAVFCNWKGAKTVYGYPLKWSACCNWFQGGFNFMPGLFINFLFADHAKSILAKCAL